MIRSLGTLSVSTYSQTLNGQLDCCLIKQSAGYRLLVGRVLLSRTGDVG
jgi:hypothetical protein